MYLCTTVLYARICVVDIFRTSSHTHAHTPTTFGLNSFVYQMYRTEMQPYTQIRILILTSPITFPESI